MAVIEITTAREQFLLLKKDLSDVGVALFLQWANFVNRWVYRRLIATDQEKYLSQQIFTIQGNPDTQPLPDDFRDIQENNTGFFQIDNEGKDTEFSLINTGFGRRDEGFYITGDNVVFTGLPDGRRFTLRYIPKTVDFTTFDQFFTQDGTETGKIIVDSEYMDYLLKNLDVFYTIWDEVGGAEAFADARFIRTLDELLTSVRKEPDAYQLDDFTQSF